MTKDEQIKALKTKMKEIEQQSKIEKEKRILCLKKLLVNELK